MEKTYSYSGGSLFFFVFSMMICNLAYNVYNTYRFDEEKNELELQIKLLEKREMCFNETERNFPDTREVTVGYYRKEDNFYCVWTKDQNESEIINTDNHEKCHYFVAENKEHFCEKEIIK